MLMDANARVRTSRAVILCAIVLIFGVLYVARDVFIPLALSLLLSFVLAPLVIRLQHLGLPKIPAVGLVVSFAFVVIGAISWLVAVQVADLAAELPKYRQNIVAKIDVIENSMQRAMQKTTRTMESLTHDLENNNGPPSPASGPDQLANVQQPSTQGDGLTDSEIQGPPETAATSGDSQTPRKAPVEVAQYYTRLDLLRMAMGPILSPLATAVIVIVFTIFILVQREDLRDRVIRLCGYSRMNLTTELLDEGASRVSRYLLLLILVNGITGTAVGIGLTVIGVPNGLLWGLLAALLRFVPYVGPWIAAIMPITLATAVFDGWTRPLMVIGLFLLIEILSNNFLEPWLYGTKTGASPFAIIVSAVFWTWLWGGVGLLLATPLTVCLVVLGKYVPQLEFLRILLGDTPPLKPSVHYYQRLLALDREEADEAIKKALKGSNKVQVFDEIIVPALRQAENDRHHGELNERREAYIFESVRDLLEELSEIPAKKPEDGQQADESLPVTRPRLRVVCIPARDEADQLVAQMLAQLVDPRTIECHILSQTMFAGEMLTAITQDGADYVCISALPPSTISHSRYLCKRLRREFPNVPILIGLWDTPLDQQKTIERLGCGPDIEVVGSLAEAVQHLANRTNLQTSPPPSTPAIAIESNKRAAGLPLPSLAT